MKPIHPESPGPQGNELPVRSHPQESQKNGQHTGNGNEQTHEKGAQKNKKFAQVDHGNILTHDKLPHLEQSADEKNHEYSPQADPENGHQFLEDLALQNTHDRGLLDQDNCICVIWGIIVISSTKETYQSVNR
jgi:hypothetical protein